MMVPRLSKLLENGSKLDRRVVIVGEEPTKHRRELGVNDLLGMGVNLDLTLREIAAVRELRKAAARASDEAQESGSNVAEPEHVKFVRRVEFPTSGQQADQYNQRTAQQVMKAVKTDERSDAAYKQLQQHVAK